MTKVALKGPVNGTGTYTLRAPETANTLELELPTAGTHLAGAQADGMPLGPGGDPVVESGSNSDGQWVRWADGTQQCRNQGSVITFSSGSAGALTIITMPLGFVADNAFSVTLCANANSITWGDPSDRAWSISARYASSNIAFDAVIVPSVGNTTAGSNGSINYIANGRWK